MKALIAITTITAISILIAVLNTIGIENLMVLANR